MNTNQIAAVINSDPSCKGVFRGVMARDQFLKQNISYPSLFVCNTDNSDQPGSHWTAVYFREDAKCEYFDSYGIPPLFNDVEKKLLAVDASFSYNDCELQSSDTNVCGMYCILFAKYKCRGYSLQEILNILLFVNDSEERDHIIRHYFMTNLSETIKPYGQLPKIHHFDGVILNQNCLYKSYNSSWKTKL